MIDSESANFAGRCLVAFYFLWATFHNLRDYRHHICEFKRVGMSAGRLFFAIGFLLSAGGSLALLYEPGIVYGGLALIVFTLSADLLFHRYWTYKDDNERAVHRFFLFEHLALNGGILGLIAPHL